MRYKLENNFCQLSMSLAPLCVVPRTHVKPRQRLRCATPAYDRLTGRQKTKQTKTTTVMFDVLTQPCAPLLRNSRTSLAFFRRRPRTPVSAVLWGGGIVYGCVCSVYSLLWVLLFARKMQWNAGGIRPYVAPCINKIRTVVDSGKRDFPKWFEIRNILHIILIEIYQ